MTDENVRSAKDQAQTALYTAITDAVADLRKNAGAAAQAEGLKNLAEAYAWLSFPNQPHG